MMLMIQLLLPLFFLQLCSLSSHSTFDTEPLTTKDSQSFHLLCKVHVFIPEKAMHSKSVHQLSNLWMGRVVLVVSISGDIIGDL